MDDESAGQAAERGIMEHLAYDKEKGYQTNWDFVRLDVVSYLWEMHELFMGDAIKVYGKAKRKHESVLDPTTT